MKIQLILEKISAGAQTGRVGVFINKMNKQLWEEYRASLDPETTDEWIFTDFNRYKKWCITNKMQYMESQMLKIGKTIEPSLKIVKLYQNEESEDFSGSSFYRDGDKVVSMHVNEGLPLVEYNASGLDSVFKFIRAFIHEIYHAVQYGTDHRSEVTKRRSLSTDNKFWTDKSEKEATYDHHSVTPIEIEAMANDTFAEVALKIYGVDLDDYEDISPRIKNDYPSWADFLKSMRENGVDPESVVATGGKKGYIFRRRDGTPFSLTHPIEGKALKMFIKEYLKVAQNFYYGGIEDDTGKFRKQREIGKQRKQKKSQDKLGAELENYMRDKHQKLITLPSNQQELSQFKYDNLMWSVVRVDYEHDRKTLGKLLATGHSINGWIQHHIHPVIAERAKLKNVNIQISIDNFDGPDLQYDDGNLSGTFGMFEPDGDLSEYNVEQLMLDVYYELLRFIVNN